MHGSVFLAALLALGQAPDLPPELAREYSASDAAVQAVFDLMQNVGRKEWAGSFYVWDNIGENEKSAGAINYTVNAVLSRRPVILYPARAGKDGRLLRYNLYDLAPDERDFACLFKEWNRIADIDPVFHEPADKPQVETIYETVTPYLASDGKTYDYIAKQIVRREKTQDQIASGGAGPLRLLVDLTGNRLPIISADFFIPVAWSAIKIDGVDGRYYQLRGIQVGGKNDFDAFLEQFGSDARTLRKLRADQRTLMKSGVAKRFRQIDLLPAFGTSPQFGPSYITVSHDINNKEDDPANDPLENLIDFQDAAREIIAALPNGLHAYLLTNGQGAAQLEVPADIAAWPNSPHGDGQGGTKQLVPGISCLECHSPNRGYNPTKNYVRELKVKGFAAKFDFRVGKVSYKKFVDLLSDLYDGDFDAPLKLASAGYANAADLASLRAFGKTPIEGVGAEIVRIYGEYFLEINTVRALRDLGYRWTGSKEIDLLEAFNWLVPPAEDDPGRLGALRINRPINRYQWNQIRHEVALRDRVRAGLPPLSLPTGFRDVGIGAKAGAQRFADTRSPAFKAETKAVTPVVALPRRHDITPAVAVSPKRWIDVQYTAGSGSEIWGPAYTEIELAGHIRNLGPQGYLWFSNGVPVGQVWLNYPMRIGKETVKVDVYADRHINIVLRGSP